MTIDISIVGLVNYIDKEKLEDFYGSAPGKDVIIKLEPGNVYDPRAVVTLLDGKTIGYVRKADVSDKGLFTLLTKESRHTYNAKIQNSLLKICRCRKKMLTLLVERKTYKPIQDTTIE